jgi:biotin carboxylase
LSRLLFVESNTTGTGMLALRRAAALGLAPVLLTHDPGRYRGLEETGCPVVRCDTNDLDALRTAVEGLGLAEVGGLTTTSEFYVVTVAELAARYGLPGSPAEAVRTCRNKARTRAVLTAAGLPQPAFRALSNPAETAEAVAHVGLPCVVKPPEDTGSMGVLLCERVEEARAQVRRLLAARTNVRGQPLDRVALVEEYLPGPELSVETVTCAGRTTCVGVTEKTVAPGPQLVEIGHVFPASLPAATRRAVVSAAEQALRAAGFSHGVAHTEVKLVAGSTVVVEINARPAGGMIPELVRLVTGVDLVDVQLVLAIGREPALRIGRDGRTGIAFVTAELKGMLERVHGLDEARRLPGIVAAELSAVPGDRVRPPESSYDRLGWIIARGRTRPEVLRRLEAARALLELETAAGESHDRAA